MSGTPTDNKNSVRIMNKKKQINYRFFQVETTVNHLRANINEILAFPGSTERRVNGRKRL
jgi:hypothetical protein